MLLFFTGVVVVRGVVDGVAGVVAGVCAVLVVFAWLRVVVIGGAGFFVVVV